MPFAPSQRHRQEANANYASYPRTFQEGPSEGRQRVWNHYVRKAVAFGSGSCSRIRARGADHPVEGRLEGGSYP